MSLLLKELLKEGNQVGCLRKKLLTGIVKCVQCKSIILNMLFVQLQITVPAPKP